MSPKNMKCVEMELQVKHGSHWEYPVAVLDSPAGKAQGTLQFPLGAPALQAYLEAVQAALLHTGQKSSKKQLEQESAVQDFGSKLFEALFSGELRSLYDSAREQAEEQQKLFQLKLDIQPPEMAALPWELLYDAQRAEYLSRSDSVSILRSFESPRAGSADHLSPPLRILAMVSSPNDLPALDVEKERLRLETATAQLQERELVELTWVEGQTWKDLHGAFQNGPWHVFAFIGYGGSDRDTDRGYAVLADDAGTAHRLSAIQLSNLLASHDSLQLVLLTGRQVGPDSEPDRFSRTSATLVRQGIPSVLVMQHDVADEAVTAFAETFYPSLGMAETLTQAVFEARQAIFSAAPETPAWGTLALYTHEPDLRPLDKESLVTTAIERGDEALAKEDYQRAIAQFELISALGAGGAVAGRQLLVGMVRRTLEEAQSILDKLTSGEEVEADKIIETQENLEEIGRQVPNSRSVQVLISRTHEETNAYRDRLWQEGLGLMRGKTVGLTLGRRYRNTEESAHLLAKAAKIDQGQTPALSDDLTKVRHRLAYLETARTRASTRRKRRLAILGIIAIVLVGALVVLSLTSGLVPIPTFLAETSPSTAASATSALSQVAAPTVAASPTTMPESNTTIAPSPTSVPQTQPVRTATARPGSTATSRSGSATSVQSTPSATSAASDTANPTRTSTPTPRPPATGTPSTTPSPTSTGSPTAEQEAASPVPTQRPAPSATPTPGIIYPAPVLLEPDDGAYIRQTNVSSLHPLRWEWDGTLQEDEWFDIRVWEVGTPHYGIAWTKEKEYLYDSCLQIGGNYNWSIAVIRGEAGQWLGNLSPEATPHWFASGRSDKWCKAHGRYMMPPRTDGVR